MASGRPLVTLLLAGALALGGAPPAAGQGEPPSPGPAVPPPPAAEPAPAGPAAVAAPPVVRGIDVHSDAVFSREDLERVRELLAFEVGEPLTQESVDRTLRNVQASGIASRVAVLSRPAPGGDGVIAVVSLRANLLVTEIRVEGDSGAVAQDRLRGALYQRAGYPLIESRLVRGVYAMQDLLRDEGYFEATVRLEPQIDDERSRATVIYHVEAGPRATIGQVTFDGPPAPFTADQLREHLRARPGDAFRQSRVEGDAERLQRWLVDQKYRMARVDDARVDYRAADHTVELTYPLEVGPRVVVEIVGADRKKLEKHDLLPVLDPEGYDEALLLLSVQRVRSHYQEQGYYDVEVDSDESRQEDTLTVRLTVTPGAQYTLESVEFTGNEQIDDGHLRDLMQTAPKNLLSSVPFLGEGGTLVDDVLQADLDNIRSYYALQGFSEARVGPAAIDRRDHRLAVTIPIEEGERQRVVDLRFTGMDHLDPGEVRDEFPLHAGGPYHPALVDESLNTLRSRYDRLGYNSAQVSAHSDWNEDHTLADVTFDVLEGPQTVVDRIIVRGNSRTDTTVIRRSMALRPGSPVSTAGLLEAERDLYRLGIFRRVDVELTPAPLGASTRDVVVRVEEGDVQRLVYGAGYDSESGFGGLAGYSHNNLFGKAIHGSIDLRIRQERKEYRLFVDQPYLWRYKIPVTYSLSRLEERRSSFEVVRRGLRIEGVKELGRTRLGLAYDYRIVKNRALDLPSSPDTPPDQTDLRREFQELRVASLVPSVLLDRRDDPINPTRGWNSVLQLQYAFPAFAAEADFFKLFLQQVNYFPLGFGTVAVSARAGGIEPLSPLPSDIVDPFIPAGVDVASKDVFLAERFFAGGSTSHRAYEQDELGIPYSTCLDADGHLDASIDCKATLFPVDGSLRPAGGNGLALLNLEYRFPVFGPVEGVVFYDTGNVWADWRQIDLSDFRNGIGVGARYLSPIGPLRVDLGYPLDPIGDKRGIVWFISLGNPF